MDSAMELDADPRLARKRVPRACDHCRRRKSRCDGNAPCSACRGIGLSCTYGHSTAKQARGPRYVAHLERTVEELQNQTKKLSVTHFPDRQGPTKTHHSSSQYDTLPRTHEVPSLSINSQDTPSSTSHRQEPEIAYIEIMAREPRAKSFGIDVLRQLCNFCYDLPRPGGSHRQDSSMKIVQALDAPFPLDDCLAGDSAIPPLPPSDVLSTWIELAFSEALPLWHCVDKAYVEGILPRMLSTSSGFGHGETDKDDLGLLYTILALGQRVQIEKTGQNERRTQGLAYFVAARDTVPLVNCERSIPALQTVLCMALYLMAASSLTMFHAYVSSATSAALRMGLHEQISVFPEEEQALRRRVWTAVQAMELYASSALGLPSSASATEAQTESFESAFPGIDEVVLATAAHHQLTGVLSNCIERVYRDRACKGTSSAQAYAVTTKSLRESSQDLETWGHNCAFIAQQLDALASSNRDDNLAPFSALTMCSRMQLLLNFAHCHAQLLLYTPLVHHLVQPTTERNSEAYHYGTRCLRAAILAVHIAEELQRRFQLNEAYFMTVDVLVNALLVLLTVELGSSDGKLLLEAIPARRRAKEVLLNLARFSSKATECYEALAPLLQSGQGDWLQRQSVRKNVASVRDSFKDSYNTHYAHAGIIDPCQLWINGGFAG